MEIKILPKGYHLATLATFSLQNTIALILQTLGHQLKPIRSRQVHAKSSMSVIVIQF